MKYKKILVLILSFILLVNIVKAKEFDFKLKTAFGGDKIDDILCFQKASNGYAVSGTSKSNLDDYSNKGLEDGYIRRYNEKDELMWTFNYGGNGTDQFYSFYFDDDENIIAVFEYESTDLETPLKGYSDDIIFKINGQTGEVMEKHLYSTAGGETIKKIIPTYDNGYLMVGYGNTGGRYYPYGLIVKLDSNFNVIYRKYYGANTKDDYLNNVVECGDKYIVTGYFNSTGYNGIVNKTSNGSVAVLFEIDKDGNVIWINNEQQSTTNMFNGIIKLSDTEIATEYYLSSSREDAITKIRKYNINGVLLKESTVDDPNGIVLADMYPSNDGLIANGYTFNTSKPGYDSSLTYQGIITKFDKDLNYQYYIPINDGNNNVAYNVYEKDKDKYILAMPSLRTSLDGYTSKGETDVYIYEITPKKYNINVNTDGEGSLKINSKAIEGEKVSYEYVPSEGYEFENIVIKDKDGNVIETNNNTFKMPDKDVNISIKYKKKIYTITTDISVSEKIDSDEVKVEYGTDHVISFAVKYGYRLKNVYINKVDYINKIIDNKLLLSNINNNINMEVIYEKITYPTVSMTYNLKSNSNNYYIIESTKDIDKIYINNELLDENNYKYELKDNKLYITINEDYLNSLKTNVYEVKTIMEDGGEATSTIELLPIIDNPKTYDNIVTYITGFVISIIGLVLIKRTIKK